MLKIQQPDLLWTLLHPIWRTDTLPALILLLPDGCPFWKPDARHQRGDGAD